MIRKNFVLTLVFETPRGCGYRYGGYMLNNNHDKPKRLDKSPQTNFRMGMV
jgi:hypothetical protein